MSEVPVKLVKQNIRRLEHQLSTPSFGVRLNDERRMLNDTIRGGDRSVSTAAIHEQTEATFDTLSAGGLEERQRLKAEIVKLEAEKKELEGHRKTIQDCMKLFTSNKGNLEAKEQIKCNQVMHRFGKGELAADAGNRTAALNSVNQQIDERTREIDQREISIKNDLKQLEANLEKLPGLFEEEEQGICSIM